MSMNNFSLFLKWQTFLEGYSQKKTFLEGQNTQTSRGSKQLGQNRQFSIRRGLVRKKTEKKWKKRVSYLYFLWPLSTFRSRRHRRRRRLLLRHRPPSPPTDYRFPPPPPGKQSIRRPLPGPNSCSRRCSSRSRAPPRIWIRHWLCGFSRRVCLWTLDLTGISFGVFRSVSWVMENGGIEEADDALPVPAPPNGRRYRPVGSSDRAVIQMTSMEPGSSSATIDAVVTPQPPRWCGLYSHLQVQRAIFYVTC